MNAPARRLLRGASALSAAMLLANAGNYALNLFLGRVLTPAEFADANLMVTFLFSLTSIALCLQLVAARFVARADELGHSGDSDRLARRLRRIALVSGLGAGAVLAFGAEFWSTLFRTASPWPFVVLGAGVPFWLVQAVGRGVLQARSLFAPLALSFVIEMVVRVGSGVLFVSAGYGVMGATIALSASFVVTCAVVAAVARPRGGPVAGSIGRGEVRAYAALVSILLVGQIIANNSDVFIAKAVLDPTDAGIYAAVALVGRAVFFLTWSVATVVFPEAARRQAAGRDSAAVLRAGVGVVVGIGAACSLGALWVGGPVLGVVLGPDYSGLSLPLAGYAGATTLFAVANLVASYRLSQSRTTESWLLLGAAVLQTVLLVIEHRDMTALIAMQAVAMSVLVLVLAVRAVVARSRRTSLEEVLP
ncbi:oligosaccharide flippase family protein [Rathayibacter sp. VKM Ac-2759]|uniref:oligosaccharide flippase family protein n=1 Tax=Rathayibacter sp. VKM Ac-2759 TaxID=2609252 RepID=UPI0013188CD5|nr:oligosaccharide flippase family protein [Rathayibacter sp. VKM Ac-2759]QHC68014.1 oligosaccharide flippase family protein [Rathayibacter sp. VKM Ac-2759]